MDLHQRTLRIGLTVILFSAVIRLFSGLPPVSDRPPKIIEAADTETGQSVRFPSFFGSFSPEFGESAAPLAREPEIPCFSGAAIPEIRNATKTRPDLQNLLLQPLTWDLEGMDPKVLILHTHATDSYAQSKDHPYRETAAYRTLDEGFNMLFIGDTVAELLVQKGISVIHDRTLHDYPSYNGSYTHARKAIEVYLSRYPGIQLILDLHRDAAEGSSGQLRTLAQNQSCAQLMVVIGTNHDDFEENLSLGLKLHAQLELQSPGITRPLQLRNSRFNQDLLPGALLIEVGAAGNSHKEARAAAEQLALAVIALSRGTRSPENAA